MSKEAAMSGAASGAAAGTAIMPGWGTAIGAVAGGIMGGLQGGAGTAPGPGYMPDPTAPGATSTQYGGTYYDPATRSWQQVGYGFDPTQQGRVNDADQMYNQFMGQDSSRLTQNMDYQIQQLQDQLKRLQDQGTSGTGVGAKKSFAEMYPNLKNLVNADGSPQDDNQLRANPTVIAEFNRAKGGNNWDFGRWFNQWKHEAGIDEKVAEYKQIADVSVGNQDARNQAIQALQAKLGYATKERDRLGTGGADLSKNPLMKYLNDIGGMTPEQKAEFASRQGNMDATAAGAQARSHGGPMDLSGIEQFLANENTKNANFAGGLDAGTAGSINAPRLDLTEAGLKARVMDAASAQAYEAQKNLRQQQAAHRGLAGSSISEIGGAGDSLNLANAHNQNLLGATQVYNQALGQQFGMDLGAAQFGAQERGNLFGRQFNKAQLQGNEFNQNRSTQFNNLLGAGQLKLSAKQQADQQGNWGDTFANQTQQQGVGNLQYLYGQQRGENQDAYSRNLGMYNLLNNQTQQARGNAAQDYSLGLQGSQLLGGWGQNQANNQNQVNAARLQMANGKDMANWQLDNSNNAANNQAMWNGLGAIGSAAAQYYGNRPAGSSAGSGTDASLTPAQLAARQEARGF